MNLDKQKESKALLFTIISLLIYLGQNIISSLLVGTFSMGVFESRLISSMVALGFIALLIKNKIRAKYYGLRSLEKSKDVLICLPLLLMPLINLLYLLLPSVVVQGIATSIVMGVFTGIIEEFIFRGFLFRAIEERSSTVKAIVISSIIFGLFHLVNFTADPAEFVILQVIYATAIGISFAVIFTLTKSILPCIITHVFVNVLGLLFVERMRWEAQITATIILVLIALIYCILFCKRKNVQCIK